MAQALPIEKKYFAALGENGGRINGDDAAFAVGLNEWVNMSGLRSGSTDKGVTGVIESIGGNTAKGIKSLAHLCIGSVSDTVGRNIITFWQHLNDPDFDRITVYSFDDDTQYLCLQGNQVTGGLNFNKDYPIHSAEVVGDLVYWTDDLNQPKRINFKAAVKMNNPSYVTDVEPYTNPLEIEVDYLIRKPPAIALGALKMTLPSVQVNMAFDFAGQFAWRYIYRDGEKSVLSPISNFINYNQEADTANMVRVVASTNEHINQDVQQVDFCVRYGNSGNFFVIKSWNKDVASQAAEIAAHNAGSPALNYMFFNDKIGYALDAAYSYKPFDSVPFKSRCLSVALSRLFLGYNLSSYDTPTSTSLSIIPNYVTTLPYQNPIFKCGSAYKTGVIFRDRWKRVLGNVVTNDNLKFTVNDRNYDYATYCKSITWSLNPGAQPDEIPEDAYSYEIVITKSLLTRFFVQSRSVDLKYIIKDKITGEYTYQDTYLAGAFGIAVSTAILESEGMGYLYDASAGDIMKLYKSGSATPTVLPVIGQSGGYVFVKLADLGSFTTIGTGSDKFIFEIYTPYKEVGDDPFFTTGQTYLIGNPGLPTRYYMTGGDDIQGDVYLYGRYSTYGSYKAENMAINNKYWKEWLGNWGEVNIALNSRQVRKNTAVQWSNVLVEGTETNGLSSFDALDEKILPLDLGTLQKLQLTSKVQEQGNIMLAIGEQATASLYLGEVQVVGADRNAFLAQSPNVIGTVNVLKGDFGTTMPTSVTEYRGTVIWIDVNNGRVIQYASNGLFPISNYKMTRFWKNWCNKFLSLSAAEIEALGGRPFVFSIVDPAHDELLFSIPKLSNTPPKGYLPDYPSIIYPFDALDYQAKVMVYDIKESRWMGSYPFYAQGFQSLQNELYSFKTGQMWLHNQFDNQCNFYGVQYTPQIMFVANAMPAVPKVYQNTAVQSNIVPLSMYFYNDYPIQQSSDLVDFSFRNVEGNWCATILRNKLVPTATGFTTNGLLTKEVMRNSAMYCMAEFTVSGSNVLQLRFINIGYIPSVGNTTI